MKFVLAIFLTSIVLMGCSDDDKGDEALGELVTLEINKDNTYNGSDGKVYAIITKGPYDYNAVIYKKPSVSSIKGYTEYGAYYLMQTPALKITVDSSGQLRDAKSKLRIDDSIPPAKQPQTGTIMVLKERYNLTAEDVNISFHKYLKGTDFIKVDVIDNMSGCRYGDRQDSDGVCWPIVNDETCGENNKVGFKKRNETTYDAMCFIGDAGNNDPSRCAYGGALVGALTHDGVKTNVEFECVAIPLDFNSDIARK